MMFGMPGMVRWIAPMPVARFHLAWQVARPV